MAKNYRNRGENYDRRKKHSGAKEGVTVAKGSHKGGMVWVNAWNYSKSRGMIIVSAIENKRSKRVESKRGNQFISMMFEIFYKRTGNKILQVAPYCVTTGKVYLDKLGMVISTHAPNGGYFGTAHSK